MPETREEEEKRKLRELEGKNVAQYSVLLQAWIETRMERDKTIVTLAAAGIGLLITILTTVGTKYSWELLLYIGAVAGFATSIWSSLVIYQLNSEHLEQAIRGSNERDPRLEKYDKRSLRAFLLGVVFLVAIGVSASLTQHSNPGGNKMAEKNHASAEQGNPAAARQSVNGVEQLNPSGTLQKSLDGITNLSPQNTQTPAPPPQSGQSSSGGSNAPTTGANQSKK